MKTWTFDRTFIAVTGVIFFGVAVWIAINVPSRAGTQYHYEGPTLVSYEDAMPLANSRGYHNLVTLETADNGILLQYDFNSGKVREEPILAALQYTTFHSTSNVVLSYLGAAVVALVSLIPIREAVIRTDKQLSDRNGKKATP